MVQHGGGDHEAAAKAGTLQRTTTWDSNNALPQIASETNAHGAQIVDHTYNPLEQIQTPKNVTHCADEHAPTPGAIPRRTSQDFAEALP
ncbi:hypothetical protein [Streptomyces sp. RKAG337]|uniref:hypothetical protein n=1 Tax=Streptomyces sp. RKAG337 TaxID=2893404 RepID=UPI0020336B8B|nr:hypothetical protein [Streptomyces sp. RKAG337]MCM2425021.1 hypothetical protein [Streptomyces sp. RKAG337]